MVDRPEITRPSPIPAAFGTWRNDALAAWLMTDLHRPNAEMDFFSGFCERLNAEGIEIARAFVGLLSLHPLFVSRNFVWTPEGGAIERVNEVGAERTDFYFQSPVYVIHQGAEEVRQRLDVDPELLSFDIWKQGHAEGMTDYLALPLRFSNGEINVVSFATRRRAGFSTDHTARLKALLPLLSLRLELLNSYFSSSTLLNTYLGEAAARRVLAGIIHRAEGETLEAAIYFCDLRGFTALSDRLAAREIIALLDDYFDCMIEPIRALGGEVLKFMGDGMLAIFPMDARTAGLACESALAAAEEGILNLAALNHRRETMGQRVLWAGVGLHAGEVIFGNIGSADRLDFTVIGRAVNEVSRVESLTRKLNRPILMTNAFSERYGQPHRLTHVGDHALPGVAEPTAIYAPASGGR